MSQALHIARQLVKSPKRLADGSYMVHCPAHDDRTPSCAIKDSDQGDGIVSFCFAGCDWKSVRAGLEEKTDLEPYAVSTKPYIRDIAFKPDYPNPRTHIYRDKDGTAVFVVERRPRPGGGKTFRQHKIGGNNMDGVTRLPYNLHHWHDDDTIIVVEGEQSVEALNRYGVRATCNPGGAGNWQPELNKHFAGKAVYIIPDNDEPGRKHAVKVAQELHRTAKSITISNICGDMNDKDDIVQWLAGNPGVNLVDKLYEFPRWELGDQIKDPNDPFQVADYTAAAWLAKEMPPRDYLMGTILCSTSRWMIYSPTGLGKTLFSMNLSAAIAAGHKFLNWQPGRKCKALYIDGEMPSETFKERIVQVTGLFGEDIQLFGLNRDDEATRDNEMPPLNTDEGIRWLKHKISRIKPDVIVFDSIMCLLGGDMKEEESWEPVKILMKWLTNRHIAQIWVHHTGHDAGKSYGSNTREWELDTVLRLDRPQDNEDGFILNFTKHRLRTHANADEFNRIHCKLGIDGWEVSQLTKEPTKRGDDRTNFAHYIIRAYDDLVIGLIHNHVGYNGASVIAVSIEEIRRWIVKHGLIAPHVDGGDVMSKTDRRVMRRAQSDLIEAGRIAANEGRIWRMK